MVSGILISCNIMNIIYSLANKLIHSISNNIDFDISHFMVDYNISTYNLELSASDMSRVIAVGCIFIIISVTCAFMVVEKRDVL